MKTNRIVGIIGSLFMLFIFSETVFPLTPYDSFSGATINYSKWDNLDFVREIRNISGNKLFSRVTAYGNTQGNYLYVKNPGGIYYLEASVILMSAAAPYDSTHTTFSQAGLAGVFYNDGTVGSGSIGDVMAQVRLELSNGQLRARYFVLRYTAADASTWVTLDSDTIIPAISMNVPYTLKILFDQSTRKFTFTAGTATKETPLMPGSVFNLPKSNWKALRTHVQAPPGYWGSVSAAFSNAVTQNASGGTVMSDTLSTSPLNSSNWKTNFEQVREIENSHLHLKLRRVDLLENNSNALPFSLSEMINEIQAKVSLIAFQKSDLGFSLRARVGGYFFNVNGNPASNYLDEIFAGVYLGVKEGENTPKAVFYINKMTNVEGTTHEEVHSENLLPAINLGGIYTLSIQWDGNQFTAFCRDGQGATVTKTYQPVSGIFPSNIKTKLIDVRLYPPSSAVNNDSTIEATFDDVLTDIVNLYLPLIKRD